MDENQKFEEMVNKNLDEFLKRNPSLAIFLGKKEYEKDLEPGTKEHQEKTLALFSQWIEDANRFDLDKLSPENRLAIEILNYRYNIDKFLFETYPVWKKMPNGLETTQGIIFTLFQRKGPTTEVLEAIIAQINNVAKYLPEFQSRFDGSPIPKVWKDLTLMQVQSAPQFLQFLAMNFSNAPGIPENLLEELGEVIEQVKPIIQSHQAWIQDLPADEGDFPWALGAENFDTLLAIRKLPWNRETILKKGYELLKSLKARAEKVAKEIDPTKTYEEVIEMIKTDHPPTFEMVLEHTRSEAERAKEFVKTHDLVTVPEGESLVVVPTPEYLVPVIPFAAYNGAPYFDSEQPGIYLVTPTKDEEGLKRHSYAEISNVMVHEAYPGHHLDIVCSNTYSSLILMLGLAIETIEGWAHYCEEMMLQQGFHEDPKKAELVILRGQIWRAVRIIVDVELHCKQRTMEEAIKMLMDEAQMDQPSAVAEVTRYTSNPAYQLSYLIGKILIDDLRQKVEKQMGERFSLKFFHDTILQSGFLPYYLLKKHFEDKI
ncbi:MAG: DUF885 domain-containing protein [Candidatus Hodarchaeota archaeon]